MGRKVINRGYTAKSKGFNRKQVRQVQKIVDSNKKLKSKTNIFELTLSNAGTLTELTAITEGDDFYQRDTDVIRLMSAKGHYNITNGSTASAQSCRVLIVRSKVGPLVLANMPAINAMPDLDKFVVLYDQYIRLEATKDAYLPIFRFYKSFKNKKVPHLNVIYDDDKDDTASQNHGVYVFTITSAPSNQCNLFGIFKIKWFDKS